MTDSGDKEKKRIEGDVLVYLAEHPDGGDTLEGIIEWWLLERKIKYQVELIQDVIDGLVKRQLLLKNTIKDARVHYLMNKKKLKHIRTLLSLNGR